MIVRTSLWLAATCLILSFGPQAGEAEEAPASAKDDREAVSVWFASNRKREAAGSAADAYTGERGEPHFGRCTVEFKPIPLMSRVATEVSFHVPTEKREVTAVRQTDDERFWDGLTAAVERSDSGSLVLFVHGYNYGFEKTCEMAAEMQRGLRGKAAVLMFSWPSNGLPTDYVSDQADMEWSVSFLADLMKRLGYRFNPENVRVVAHSLGSRGVVFALQRLRAGRVKQPVIGPLVLIAPDFDSQTFVDIQPDIAPLTGRITLYASQNDTPLKASRTLSGYPRLGEAGEFLTLIDGMETIDVSPAGRYQILGHEYFYFHPRVANDLVALLVAGKPAAQRSGLRKRKRDGKSYWEIQ